jgi:hypothetical protein
MKYRWVFLQPVKQGLKKRMNHANAAGQGENSKVVNALFQPADSFHEEAVLTCAGETGAIITLEKEKSL